MSRLVSLLLVLCVVACVISSAEGKKVRRKPSISYYKMLYLEPGCSEGDIRRAYRKYALAIHPDKAGSSGWTPEERAKNEKMFMKLAHGRFNTLIFKACSTSHTHAPFLLRPAYEVLIDPAKREHYNKLLADGITDYSEPSADEQKMRRNPFG
jgi:hypothetical protein